MYGNTCTRCHQTIQAENCYCPACGLPQLVYTADGVPGQVQPERWNEAVRDASTVEWKPALRAALMLAVPAGLLSSGFRRWASLAALDGCGRSLGGGALRAQPAAGMDHHGSRRPHRPGYRLAGRLDGSAPPAVRCLSSGSSSTRPASRRRLADPCRHEPAVDASNGLQGWERGRRSELRPLKLRFSLLLSPEGHAGIEASALLNSFLLILFAVGGGALGARMLARTSRPEI